MQLLIVLFTAFLMPLLQPVAQLGAAKVHETLGVPLQQSQSVATQPMMQGPPPVVRPQPPQYHFDGARWYKYENGQIYVWTGNSAPF
jgi:hypothetical protein